MKKIFVALLVLSLTLVASVVNASPINLLVGFPPGGGNYIVAQIIAEAFNKMGHNTIIETKVGAGGILGMNYCEENSSNKNMICIVSQAQYVYGLDTPQLLKYNPEKITYVKMVSGSPLVLMTNANNKKTVNDIIKDLIVPINKKPVKFATAALGNKIITQEFLKLVDAKNFVEAEYKGVGDAIKDIIGEHVDYMIAPYSVVVGKESVIRIVANLGDTRHNPALYNVELLQKSVPNMPLNLNATFGLVLGESASSESKEFFYKLITEAMKDKVLIDKLQTLGMFVFNHELTGYDFKKEALEEIREFKKWKKK